MYNFFHFSMRDREKEKSLNQFKSMFLQYILRCDVSNTHTDTNTIFFVVAVNEIDFNILFQFNYQA